MVCRRATLVGISALGVTAFRSTFRQLRSRSSFVRNHAPAIDASLFHVIDESGLPHSHINDWVIFSDLHVSERSLDTCLDVLRHVHSTAVKREAGVIFLGDFWHVIF